MVWCQYGFLQKEMTHSNKIIKENLRVEPLTKVWVEFRKTNTAMPPGLATLETLRSEETREGSHY